MIKHWPIILLTLITFFLRVFRLDQQSYWIDETWSVYFANLSFGELWQLLQTAEIMPPIYHPSTIYWIQIFGDGEYSLRFYSVIASTLAIPFSYRLGKALTDRRLGWLLAGLMTVAPFQVWHGQEARMYAMLTAASAMSMWTFVALWQRWDGRFTPFGWSRTMAIYWLLYLLGTEWAIMTHYHGAVLIGIQGLFLLITWRAHWRGYLWWGATVILIILLLVPWLVFGGNLLQSYQNWVPQPTLPESYWRSLIAYSLGKLVPTDEAGWLVIPFALTYLLGLVLAPTRHWRNWSGGHMLAFLLAFTLAPNIAAWLYGELRTPVYLERYLILVQIGYLLTLAVAVYSFWAGLIKFFTSGGHSHAGAWRREASLPLQGVESRAILQSLFSTLLLTPYFLLLGINGYILVQHYTNPLYAKADWRTVAERITQFEQPGDAVLLTGDGGEHAFNFYYTGDLPLYTDFNISPHEQRPRLEGEAALNRLAEIARQHDRLWFTPYGMYLDPLLESWLAEHTHPAWHSWLGRKRLALYDTSVSLNRTEAIAHPFDEQLQLTQIDLPDQPTPAGDLLSLTLHWQLSQPTEQAYQLSMRLINEKGDRFAQSDWPPLPALAEAVNQPQRDPRSLWLPADLSPGSYLLQLVVYDPTTGQAIGGPATVGEIAVGSSQISPPLESLALPNLTHQPLGDLSIVGYVIPSQIQPGLPMWAWLYFQNNGLTAQWNTPVTFQLDGRTLVMPTLTDLVGPLDGWQNGQVRRTIIHLPTNPTLTGETANLTVTFDNQTAAIDQIDLQTRPHNYDIPNGISRLDAPLGNLEVVTLLGYHLDSSTVARDTSLLLTLFWQAHGPLPRNYTVFVQLLNAQNQVISQIDQPPLAGQAPTMTWLADEVLPDNYTLTIPPDTPAGDYQLIVGLYDPATGERLVTPQGGVIELGRIQVE